MKSWLKYHIEQFGRYFEVLATAIKLKGDCANARCEASPLGKTSAREN